MRQKIVRLMTAGERHKKTVQVSTLNPDIAYLGHGTLILDYLQG